jgi:hypothetical protein
MSDKDINSYVDLSRDPGQIRSATKYYMETQIMPKIEAGARDASGRATDSIRGLLELIKLLRKDGEQGINADWLAGIVADGERELAAAPRPDPPTASGREQAKKLLDAILPMSLGVTHPEGLYTKALAYLAAAPRPELAPALPSVDEIAEAIADARLWPGSWLKMCDAERDVMRQGAEGVHKLLSARERKK